MKKQIASALAATMLLAALPFTASANGVKVSVKGKDVVFPDAQPYKNGGVLMLPLRPASGPLGLKIAFDKASGTVRLSGDDTSVVFRLGSSTATVNGKQRSFGQSSLAKHNRIYVPLSFFRDVLGYPTSLDANKLEVSIGNAALTPEELAERVVDLLESGRYQELYGYFDDELKKAVPESELGPVWEQIHKQAGDYTGIESVSAEQSQGNTLITAILNFELKNVQLTLAVNDRQQLTGLYAQFVTTGDDAKAPASVIEEETVIGEGTDYPLGATLTLPKNAKGPVPAVVLVHGSGPHDRDETVAGYKTFRDIAWGLGEQGVAVLRYDKRTYAHANKWTPEQAAKITVKEETVDDAIAAAKLLKEDPRIDPTRVYLIGHSLGGILAPRIDAEGGDFAGLILLAGSPRSLADILYDQNNAFVAAMDDKDPKKEQTKQWIESEYAKAKRLQDMSKQEALTTTVFGLPAYYLKEMDSKLPASYADRLSKPVLVLQGEDDFQVYPDKDYVLWRELLGGKPNVTFKLYPGLNHFFVDYEGEGENTPDEYNVPGNVSQEVINDIAGWVLKQ
ncbi:alpha/beta hydrolase family protein [Paenibacillus sp. 32O-W]|uniref:alpha/beta fold hydrolase n=1 Tax=Paenibacillus sp. 32O-W TaxID=1695218 RepID=UPI00072248BA|nr:alpha/beta fold hydrolase [Paenibacillus sp. 32O-W]ALS25891.1 alpha/beta hydrolase family protein [Paenibacillus sp. 32O-W]